MKFEFKLGEPADDGTLEIFAKSEREAKALARKVWKGKLTLIYPEKSGTGDSASIPGPSDFLAKYMRERMARSLTAGSQWYFFRDGDEPEKIAEDDYKFADPRAGHVIEIVRVEGKGASAQRFAKLCKGKRWDRQRPFGAEFPVNYSELF